MNRKWLFVLAPPAVALFIAICGEIVMHLWNWLLPTLFGWHPITFWQGLGLLILCRLLFGGFAGRGPDRSHRWNRKRWENMTSEEREKLRQNLRRSRCGFGEPSFDEPNFDEPSTGKPA